MRLGDKLNINSGVRLAMKLDDSWPETVGAYSYSGVKHAFNISKKRGHAGDLKLLERLLSHFL
jgi:hypothetical protein